MKVSDMKIMGFIAMMLGVVIAATIASKYVNKALAKKTVAGNTQTPPPPPPSKEPGIDPSNGLMARRRY